MHPNLDGGLLTVDKHRDDQLRHFPDQHDIGWDADGDQPGEKERWSYRRHPSPVIATAIPVTYISSPT